MLAIYPLILSWKVQEFSFPGLHVFFSNSSAFRQSPFILWAIAIG
mgnify:CR=1 FL=1